MVKINELVKDAEQKGEPYIAVEFFPPRTPEGVENLQKRFKVFATQS